MNKSIQLIKVVAVLAMLSSCNFSEESALKQKLTDKYGEKFTIHSHGYNWVLKTYQFQASAVRFPEFIFVGEHNEDFSAFTDQYIVNYLSFIYADKVRIELEKYTYPVYVYVSLMFNDEIYTMDFLNVDTLDIEKIFSNATYISPNFYCCFFEELNENTKQKLLIGVELLLRKFIVHQNTNISLEAYFLNKDFLSTHSIKDMSFDLLKSSYPEIGMEYRKYVNKGLDIFIRTDKPYVSFNVDSFYNWSKTITPDAFGVPVTNLNKMWEKLQRE